LYHSKEDPEAAGGGCGVSGRRDDPVLVYSTERGLVCPTCRLPMAGCRCNNRKNGDAATAGDGIVRVRRETKGRGGKTVTTVSGVPLGGDALRNLASDLKRRCGTGGTVRDGVIEVQGDRREAVAALLSGRGFTVRLAGG
jgi:translation initiation factor 1